MPAQDEANRFHEFDSDGSDSSNSEGLEGDMRSDSGDDDEPEFGTNARLISFAAILGEANSEGDDERTSADELNTLLDVCVLFSSLWHTYMRQ